MYLLSALINHFILIIVVARFTSSTVLSHPIMVLLIREGWKDGKTPWKISNSQSCPAKLNADYERVVQKQNPNARNTWEINCCFFWRFPYVLTRCCLCWKCSRRGSFSKTGWRFVLKTAPSSAKNIFQNVIYCVLERVTTNFTVKIPVFFSGLIFIIFRQPWLLFRIWANLSSRLTFQHPLCLTARTVRLAVTWPQRLWISPRLLRDLFFFFFFFLSGRSATSPPNSARRWARDCSNSHRLRRQNAESKFRYFFLSFFFALNSLQSSALSQSHLSVLLFLNSAVWGRLAHQYTIRGGG